MDIDYRKPVAEFFGTFVLVFGGCGSAVLAGDKIGFLGISFAFGLSLLAMVYAIGPISGCHINPAVTLGLVVARKIGLKEAGFYVIAQILGGIVAAGILLLIAKGIPGDYNPAISGLAANGYDDHSPLKYSLVSGFITEVVLTAFLVLTVLGATDSKAQVGFGGVAIGLVLTLIHLVGIPITNTSVNPARSIGPAVFVGGWALGQLWLFIIAPLIGAVLAAGIYTYIAAPRKIISTARAEEATPSEQRDRLK